MENYHIKKVLKNFGKRIPPIIYGGSVDGNNVKKFKKISGIQGFLVGGASKSSKNLLI